MALKKLEIIIRSSKLDEVKNEVSNLGIRGMTVSEVVGFGRQKGHYKIYRGAEYAVSFIPKTKIEIVVDSDMVDIVVEKIIKVSNTGNIGDGKIFISSIDNAIRIRTNEKGIDAI